MSIHRRNDKEENLMLHQFLQKQRALNLWRDIVRAVNSQSRPRFPRRCVDSPSVYTEIPASNTRNEMRNFARDEFERNRDVHDVGHIRYLISVSPPVSGCVTTWYQSNNACQTGRTQFDGMQRYINEQVL